MAKRSFETREMVKRMLADRQTLEQRARARLASQAFEAIYENQLPVLWTMIVVALFHVAESFRRQTAKLKAGYQEPSTEGKVPAAACE